MIIPAGLASALGFLLWAAPPRVPGQSWGGLGRWLTSTPPAAVLSALAGWAAWLCLVWLLGGALLTSLAHLPGVVGRLSAAAAGRLTPVLLRRLVQAAMGTALVTGSFGAGGTALAGSGTSARPAGSDAAASSSWPSVDRAGAAPRPGDRTGPASTRAGGAVVVRPGDSLWRIAQEALGGSANAADVAEAWPRWYAANRQTVGPDPDVIRPGELLFPPASSHRQRVPASDPAARKGH